MVLLCHLRREIKNTERKRDIVFNNIEKKISYVYIDSFFKIF